MTLTPWNRVTINCRPATAVTRFRNCVFEGSFIFMTLSLCTFIFVVPQEDEEDYFTRTRKGRDRVSVVLQEYSYQNMLGINFGLCFQYDSKQDEEEEEEEEAPSPMARDLDALSKMSNLRADESNEKPSIRAENKAKDVDTNIHSTPRYNSLLILFFHVIG